MARLTDPETLTCFQNALKNWRYEGYVVFEDRPAAWLQAELPDHTQRSFKELLYRYIFRDGGEIDQVVEQREHWRDLYSHHYDLRPSVGGRLLYVETRLRYSDPNDPDDPMITIVNIHYA